MRYPFTQEGWAELWREFQRAEPGAAGLGPMSGVDTGTTSSDKNIWAVLSIAFAVVGLLILPIIFAPLAVVFGIVAVTQGHKAGWIGIILGVVEIVIVLVALNDVGNSFGRLPV
jgi:hypothetical protein